LPAWEPHVIHTWFVFTPMLHTHKWHVLSAFEFLYLFDECMIKGCETFLKPKLFELQHVEYMLYYFQGKQVLEKCGGWGGYRVILYQWYPTYWPQTSWGPQGYSKGPESSHDFTASLPSSQGLVLLLFFCYSWCDVWNTNSLAAVTEVTVLFVTVFSDLTWILKFSCF